MNTPPQTPEAEVITRFLLRFADLMSTGSNAANLLLAAQLLDANMKRANDADEQLRQERSNCTELKAQLAVSQDDTVQIPASILWLAVSQFKSLPWHSRNRETSSRKLCVKQAQLP